MTVPVAHRMSGLVKALQNQNKKNDNKNNFNKRKKRIWNVMRIVAKSTVKTVF